jgi:hypothetical protein
LILLAQARRHQFRIVGFALINFASGEHYAARDASVIAEIKEGSNGRGATLFVAEKTTSQRG